MQLKMTSTTVPCFATTRKGLLLHGLLGGGVGPGSVDVIHRLASTGFFFLQVGAARIPAAKEGRNADGNQDVWAVTFPTGFPIFAASFSHAEVLRPPGQPVLMFGECLPQSVASAHAAGVAFYSCTDNEFVLHLENMLACVFVSGTGEDPHVLRTKADAFVATYTKQQADGDMAADIVVQTDKNVDAAKGEQGQ
jgi:hypothetical protein